MVAPVFQREGARIGGLTTDGISMVARTDSNGQRLYLDVYTDSNRQLLAASSSAGTLNAGNNYCATVRVTGFRLGANTGGERVRTMAAAAQPTVTRRPTVRAHSRLCPPAAACVWRLVRATR